MDLSLLANFGIIIGIVFVIGIAVVALAITRLYQTPSSKEILIRTGLGGEKINMTSGIIVVPGFHQLQRVPLSTFQYEVTHAHDEAIITEDRMRIDVRYKVALHIDRTPESARKAAQTLEDLRNLDSTLRRIALPKVIDAMRTVAVSMEFEELYRNRDDFRQGIVNAVKSELEDNGLVLESISIESLDQTALEHWNENNLYDAHGMIRVTEMVEASKKRRNDIKRDNEVLIQKKDLDAHKKSLELTRDEEYATLEKDREVSIRTAEQQAEIKEIEADRNRSADVAKINANREIESARIKTDLSLEQARIQSEQEQCIAEQEKEVEINKKSQEVSEASAKADEKRSIAVTAEESVLTSKNVARANREREIGVINARKDAEVANADIIVSAESRRKAAEDDAESIKVSASAEAGKIIVLASANEKMYSIDAKGIELKNSADNVLSAEQIAMRVQIAVIEALPSIIAESVRPIEAIDSVRIVQADGLVGGAANMVSSGNKSAGVGVDGASMPEQFMNSALQYRVGSKMVDSMMESVGLNGKDFEGLTALPTKTLQELSKALCKNENVEPVCENSSNLKNKESMDSSAMQESVTNPDKEGEGTDD